MSDIDVILPHMRGSAVTVGTRVHALFIPNVTKANLTKPNATEPETSVEKPQTTMQNEA